MKVGDICICLVLLFFTGCKQKVAFVAEKPAFIRGLLMEEPFPESREAWLQLMETCSEYGFNYMKSADGIMPDEAYEAAKVAGFYIGTDSLPLIECNLEDGGYPDISRSEFEKVRHSLRESRLEGLADDFVFSCGRKQVMCLKRKIETELYVRGCRGFLLRGWRDSSESGNIGIINEDGSVKNYISGGEFGCFCAPVVALFPMKKRVFTNDEVLSGELKILNGTDSLKANCNVKWWIDDYHGRVWQADTLATIDIPAGSNKLLGKLDVSLKDFVRPVQLKLNVRLGDCYNSWNFVVYPKEQNVVGDTKGVRMITADQFNERELDYLKAGGKLLLTKKIGCTNTRNNENILCAPTHPALSLFPAFSYNDGEWKDILQYSVPIKLAECPSRPIVRIVDYPDRNHSLALLSEACVGKGKVLLAGCDLVTEMEKRPASKQLLCSLKSYMGSKLFAPTIEITEEALRAYGEKY